LRNRGLVALHYAGEKNVVTKLLILILEK
jgi:hypothetical protein